MGGTVDPTAESRRHHLAALAYEAEVRGLDCRLVGPAEDILRVAEPSTGQSVMVVAMPSSPVTWSYLWSGGGIVSAADPSRAAGLIAASLGR
jgi:hypothetical protein